MYFPQRGIDWDGVPLGQKPDTVLARELGVAPQVVQRARVRRNIPRFQRYPVKDEDWESVGLGERPDKVIAAECGVSARTVCYHRRKRGIPAFVGLLLTQEGDPCRSVYEAMYDAYLHSVGLSHEHEVPVPGLPFVADFRVGPNLVEIVGMTSFGAYREKLERKRLAYANAGAAVQWGAPPEVRALYASSSVPVRFRARSCLDCDTQTYDLVKGVCRRCYMNRWRRSAASLIVCAECGRPSRARDRQRFCSRRCYWQSNELDWPTWEDLEHRLRQRPIRQVAFDLGVKPSTLYMRLRRKRLHDERRNRLAET